MQPEVKIYTTRNGTQYALFAQPEIISDEIRRSQYWNIYNLEVADIILSESSGKRVIDIGSEAFEPVPAINEQLNTNVLLNRLDNVRCHRIGVADKNEVVDHAIFDLAAVNHGAFSFLIDSYTNRNIPIPNEVDVYELRTLDDYRFGNVGLIKVTVSGMELEVLRGAKTIIENNQTPPLMIECWSDEWYKERKEAMIEIIKECGYKQVLLRRNFIFAFNDINLFKKVEQRINEQLPGSRVVFK